MNWRVSQFIGCFVYFCNFAMLIQKSIFSIDLFFSLSQSLEIHFYLATWLFHNLAYKLYKIQSIFELMRRRQRRRRQSATHLIKWQNSQEISSFSFCHLLYIFIPLMEIYCYFCIKTKRNRRREKKKKNNRNIFCKRALEIQCFFLLPCPLRLHLSNLRNLNFKYIFRSVSQ